MAEKLQICPICGGNKLLYHSSGKTICLYCDTVFSEDNRQLSTEKIYDNNINGILEIRNTIGGETLYGTGIIVSDQGFILTSAHVIGKTIKLRGVCDTVLLYRNRSNKSAAHIISVDYSLDLALLYCRGYKGTKPIEFTNKTCNTGERVCVIGNGKGEGLCIVDGIVSNNDVNINGRHLSVISSPITNGYSGGPVINLRGETIGIVTAGRSDAVSMNYAVPSYIVNEFLASQSIHEEPIIEPNIDNNKVFSTINRELTDKQRMPPDMKEHHICNLVSGEINNIVVETRVNSDGNVVYSDNFGFDYVEDNEFLTLAGYCGPGGVVEIPGYFNGMQVKKVGYNNCICHRKDITDLIIGEGVEIISDWPFTDNTINTVYLPSTLREIGKVNNPFFQTFNKKFVVSEDNPYFTTDEDGLFVMTKDKKEIRAFALGNTGTCTIPEGVERIGLRTFCFSKLSHVEIPDSVTEIGMGAFLDSRDLLSLNIPKNVRFIDCAAAASTRKLEHVTVDRDNENYYSINNVVYDKNNNIVFAAQSSTTSDYTIPNCRTILECAYGGNQNLVNVVIPDGVIEIESEAFIFCHKLRTMIVPDSVQSMHSNIFDHSMNEHRDITLYGRKGSTAEEYAAQYGYAFCEIETTDTEVRIVNVISNNQNTIHVLFIIGDKKIVCDENAFNNLKNNVIFGYYESNAKEIADSRNCHFIGKNYYSIKEN